MNKEAIDLSVSLGKMELKNPVMTGSGTFGYGEEFADFLNLDALGAIVVKGTTLNPRLGNFENRFIEINGCCFLSCVGLQNVGVHSFVKDKLPYLRQFKTPVVVNVACESVDEFARVSEVLDKAEGVSGLEINLACPNVSAGGRSFAAYPDTTFAVIKAIRNTTGLTVIPKLAPSATDIVTLAKTCEEAGADAIRPSFNAIGMAIDIHTRKSKLGKNLVGGIGGPLLKTVAMRMVWEVSHAVRLPIVGGGGITSAEDAIEYLIAGASAVEIGTYALIDPQIFIKAIKGITGYLADNGLSRVKDIIGSMIVTGTGES